jgi:hypothetical protein
MTQGVKITGSFIGYRDKLSRYIFMKRCRYPSLYPSEGGPATCQSHSSPRTHPAVRAPAPLAAQSYGSTSFVSSATALCAVRSARHSETSPQGLELSPVWQCPPPVPHATPSTRPPHSPHSGRRVVRASRRQSEE